ncbi:EXOC5 [Blepharisma stoltei]|uniref:Exocyst complex component Sec10-like alpha-helical bundle domain-containing protein n=1 Tax=Blepharisma stoltei TaxID=1481888 RepID=A0AAU9KI81_9CILI|nr:unnamed protein product [Blepharisma stoltei]
MEEFDPVQHCEKLLKNHEIINLTSLEGALNRVKTELEKERDTAIEEIEKIQNELKGKGGMNLHTSLVERHNKAQKGLDLAGVMVKDLNQGYAITNKLIEEKDKHRKNAILIYELVNELLHLNNNESDICLSPQHCILLKHSLDSLDLTEFAIAQQIIASKFLSQKAELIEKFRIGYEKKEIDIMKDAYNLLADFNGQNECLQFYISKITETVGIRDKKTSFDLFESQMEAALREAESVFSREIISNHPKLSAIFGDTEPVVTLLLAEIIELKLKPFVHNMLDSDNITTLRYLEYLSYSHSHIHEMFERIKTDTHQLNIQISSTLDHLFNNIFGPFLSNYFTVEFKTVKSSLDTTYNFVIEPVANKGIRIIVDMKQIISPDEEVRKTIDACLDSVGRVKNSDIITVIRKAMIRCKDLSQPSEVHANCGQLVTIGLDTAYTSLFPYLINKIITIMNLEGNKQKYLSNIFCLLSEIWKIATEFNKAFLKQLINTLQDPEKEHCDGLRKRLSVSIEQNLMKGLNKCINQIITECEKILTNEQKKQDYLKNEKYTDNTQACSAVYEFLSQHIGIIKASLPPAQSSKLLSNLGTKFIAIVVEHLSKFTISQEKALLLSSDMNKYRNLVLLCENDKAVLDFEKFRQMMNLFMLPPNSLADLIHAEPIASIDRTILAEFISHREDFKTARVSKYLPSIFPQGYIQ